METQVYYRVQVVEATPMTHKEFLAEYGTPLPDGHEGVYGYAINTRNGHIWAPTKEFDEITYASGKDAIVALKGLVKTVTTKDIQEKLDAALELYDERNSLGRRIYTKENVIKLTDVPRHVLNKALQARKGV